MKIEEVLKVAGVVRSAKVTKMEDADKMKVIKASRALNKVVKEYESLVEDVKEKMKDERFDDMMKRYQAFQPYDGKPLNELTKEQLAELNDIRTYFGEYEAKVNGLLREEVEKESDADYERLTEEAFIKLIGSNDYTVDVMDMLQDVLV